MASGTHGQGALSTTALLVAQRRKRIIEQDNLGMPWESIITASAFDRWCRLCNWCSVKGYGGGVNERTKDRVMNEANKNIKEQRSGRNPADPGAPAGWVFDIQFLLVATEKQERALSEVLIQ